MNQTVEVIMATSSPLRLDPDLVRLASAAARVHKRSVPRQIELWAEIGRVVEKNVSAEDLLAIREGLARIVLEKGASVAEPGQVFARLEKSRTKGDLADRVCEAAVRYQSSPAVPGLLERIEPDGSRTTGRFVGGEFVPVKP